eukprot:TRINITY_DN9314_c0_g1_i3.p1 TRINITY_DN9314_c0_g1~~TRINITY_DN9314_c0_g1_i3.p1  ORF type:complete len:284 (-),score=-35.50 TRINITY_DN9314_c0_g1_i3:155-973(-)
MTWAFSIFFFFFFVFYCVVISYLFCSLRFITIYIASKFLHKAMFQWYLNLVYSKQVLNFSSNLIIIARQVVYIKDRLDCILVCQIRLQKVEFYLFLYVTYIHSKNTFEYDIDSKLDLRTNTQEIDQIVLQCIRLGFGRQYFNGFYTLYTHYYIDSKLDLITNTKRQARLYFSVSDQVSEDSILTAFIPCILTIISIASQILQQIFQDRLDQIIDYQLKLQKVTFQRFLYLVYSKHTLNSTSSIVLKTSQILQLIYKIGFSQISLVNENLASV